MFMKITKSIIAQDSHYYLAWPDLVRTRSGRLFCVYSACTHHSNRSFTQLQLVSSDDNGDTWSASRPVSEPCGLSIGYYYNNTAISQLADGRIVIVADRIDGANEDLANKHLVLFFSQDDGRTWLPPIDTPASGIVPDRLLELSGGRWLLSCHTYDLKLGKLVQRLWFSEDYGRTWSGPILIGRDPKLNLCEASILEDRGKLVCFMRENSGLGLPVYRAFSQDGGMTWSPVTPFPIPGCHRPKAGFLSNGDIAITYRFFQGGSSTFQNLFLALTNTASAFNPDFAQCSTRILPIDCDRSAHPDTGYSGWVELPSHDLCIVNYANDRAPLAHICAYRLPAAELQPLPESPADTTGSRTTRLAPKPLRPVFLKSVQTIPEPTH